MPPRPNSLMSSPRLCTSFSAASNVNAPAFTSAVYSPRLWPALKRRLHAVADEAAKRLEAGDLVRQQRGLSEAREVQLLARVAKAELGHVVTDDLAGTRIEISRDGERLDEVGTHASILRSLPRKDVKNLLFGHARLCPDARRAGTMPRTRPQSQDEPGIALCRRGRDGSASRPARTAVAARRPRSGSTLLSTHEPEHEEHAGDQHCAAMIVVGEPSDGAIAQRAQDRRELHGKAPQPEEFRVTVGGRQITDERAAGRLARAQAQAGDVGGDPETDLVRARGTRSAPSSTSRAA